MTLYRYEDVATTSGVRVYLRRYVTHKETRCYWYVWTNIKERMVKKDARKKFAHPTVEEAAVSFKARKQRQFTIHKARMQQVLAAMHAELPDH